MEVMEDGNLMDKVHILIQRDMEYYKSKQSILQETICPGIIGGRLDFPRSASFASTKLVLWWEEEYLAAYKEPSGFCRKRNAEEVADERHRSEAGDGMVKDSDPTKFVNLISKSADQLLEHLHILTQEALDHADLTVLTGTIGATALLKNCLWFYIQTITKDEKVDQILTTHKKYKEMCEALAERLLDLHCRLLSLYILQDAECLDWENEKPFSECERGSYIVQMWWLYMQGIKEDLWNTVPPSMAQRVFSGMLNESLTILTIRYTQSLPSDGRSRLLVVDISNLLLCVAQLLPSICESARELVGFSYTTSSKILRDVHTKCQELLSCLLLRGALLEDLYKIFKRGLDNVDMFKSRGTGVAPWIMFALPDIFRDHSRTVLKMDDLKPHAAVALELMVLLAQPQPNWALLLKVLCMKKCIVLQAILHSTSENLLSNMQKIPPEESDCGAFLCCADGSCRDVSTSSTSLSDVNYFDLVASTTDIIVSVGNQEDLSQILLPAISARLGWANSFERRNVWNQIRPPWYEAILNFAFPLIPITVDTVINAVQTGATMYQAMSLVLACIDHFWDDIHPNLAIVATLIQERIQTNVAPLSDSCLMQVLVSALYSHLLKRSERVRKEVKFQDEGGTVSTQHKNQLRNAEEISLAVAECLCSIDEDNKHTDQIGEFLERVEKSAENERSAGGTIGGTSRMGSNQKMCEVLTSDILMSTSGKRSLKNLHHFIKCNGEWLNQQLGIGEHKETVAPTRATVLHHPLLHTMFHIGNRPFDQVLSGEWIPDWINLLQIPMGLHTDRVWKQVSARWDFRNPTSSAYNMHMINSISTVLK